MHPSTHPSLSFQKIFSYRMLLVRTVLVVALVLTCQLIWPTTLLAEEPAERFLLRLREEGLYDMGLKYLELSAAKNRLPASIKDDLPLERIILLQDSLKTVKTPQQRDERIAKIEKGYKDFLAESPKHPRRSEAQTKLGDLLLSQAQTALDDSKKDENKASSDVLKTKARGIYTEALALYGKITEELKPILESMAGDKIKAGNVAAKALRDRYRNEYRQAQVLEAKMMEFISQTYEPQSAEWKQWLEKSEKALSELIDKTSGQQEGGWRILSLLYRGDVQSQLSKIDEARDSFMRVADTDFKTWRIQAIAGMVRLDSSEKSGKYEAAIEKGEEALKSASANDRTEPIWLDLQLALAEARLAWGKKLEEKKEDGKFKNNRRMARELLQNIVKRNGPHQAKAKKLLSFLGIEVAEKIDIKLPETKNFSESIKAARERLERGESNEGTTLPILEQQLIGADETTKQNVLEQIQNTKDEATRDRKQAIELYHRAIRQFKDKDSREDLLETKFLLAYLYFRTEQYWECVAIAQELLVSARGTEKAQRSGGFALMGLSKLIAEAPPERQVALTPPLERLSHKLIAMAPESEEASNAVELLVKLALINKRYDDAERFVSMGAGKGGSGASILGQLLWGDHRRKLFEHRTNKTEPSAEDLGLKDRAEKLLRSTWDNLEVDKADKNIVLGVNALANLYLSSDRVEDALLVLDEPTKGAIQLISTKPDIEPAVQLEAYRLKLQTMVQVAGRGNGQLDDKLIAHIVGKMKDLSAADDSLLTKSLSNLAVELKSKLDASKDPVEQAKLGTAFGVLIRQLVSVSSDINTLDSAGTAIFALSTNMIKTPGMVENGKQLMAIAEEAFSKVATKPEADLVAAGRKPDDFQFKLALSKSGSGKFEEAHKIFVQALTKSATNLTIQVEAARNLQLWANGKDTDLLKKAFLGTQSGPKGNIVWGWGQISKVTSSRMKDFQDVFFEARLNIANCRRLIALNEKDPNKKKTTLESAVGDIRATYKTYPELGGPEHESNFNKLLKDLQQDLGQPMLGLAALGKNAPPQNAQPQPNPLPPQKP
jgi:tetratricopeptide (TPR) repeat protein